MPIELNEALEYTELNTNSILSCNIQSYNSNAESLKNVVYQLDPSIINLCEIWQPKLCTTIENYHPPLSKLRKNRQGGGISIYIKQDLNFEEFEPINKLECKDLEKLSTLIINPDNNVGTFLLISIYRPPNSNFKNSLIELKNIIDKAFQSKKPFIVAGDVNIDCLSNNYNKTQYIDLLQSLQLNLKNKTEPTRITSVKKSLIDHVITHPKLEPIQSYVVSASIADHLPTLTVFHKRKSKPIIENARVKRVNYKKLENLLTSREIDNLENMDCNDSFNSLHDLVTDSVSKCTYEISKANKPKQPWITNNTIKLGRTVNRLRKKFIRINSERNESLYKLARSEHQRARRQDKREYYKNKLASYSGNSRKTWMIINETLNRSNKQNNFRKETIVVNDVAYTDELEIANTFNNYYKDVAVSISNEIEESKEPLEYYLNQSKKSSDPFDVIEVTNEEVYETVMSLSNKNSSGHDGISNNILKKIIHLIVGILTICINKSFNEGIFPQRLKISKISPIFKKGDRTMPGNWRPIAQLSSFSKIYELLFMKQITEQINRAEILHPKQFGFRKSHSTLHPLMITKNFIETELNEKKYVCIISLDLKKAFDCCRTDGTLQNKIKYYTQSNKITNWIDSYYKNRKQFTEWSSSKSKTVNNHSISIVQGSSIGPKIFNLYINELPKISKFKTVLFADDTNLKFSCSDPQILNEIVNKELEIIKDFFNANGLSINVDKTTFLVFSPKNRKKISLDIKMGEDKLKEADEITFLGIILENKTKDNKMIFKKHFEKVYDKAKNGLNGLLMVKNLLNYNAKINIYHSLIHSHLSYCALVWIKSLTSKQTNMLKVLQKRAIRAVFKSKYNAHTGSLFEKSNVTKVENIFEREAVLMTHKYQNRNLPSAIIELFDKSQYQLNRMTRQLQTCTLRPRSDLYNGDLMFDIFDCWNRIGSRLREEVNFAEFKKKLKIVQNKFLPCDKINCYICKN